MYKVVRDISRLVFIISVYIVTLIIIGGIWEIIESDDLVAKSIMSLVFVMVGALFVSLGAKALGHDHTDNGQYPPIMNNQ